MGCKIGRGSGNEASARRNLKSGCLCLDLHFMGAKIRTIRPAAFVLISWATRSASAEMATEDVRQFVRNSDKAFARLKAIIHGNSKCWYASPVGLAFTDGMICSEFPYCLILQIPKVTLHGCGASPIRALSASFDRDFEGFL